MCEAMVDNYARACAVSVGGRNYYPMRNSAIAPLPSRRSSRSSLSASEARLEGRLRHHQPGHVEALVGDFCDLEVPPPRPLMDEGPELLLVAQAHPAAHKKHKTIELPKRVGRGSVRKRYLSCSTHWTLQRPLPTPVNLPRCGQRYQALEAIRAAAHDAPWTQAILRCLELEDYQNLAVHASPWIRSNSRARACSLSTYLPSRRYRLERDRVLIVSGCPHSRSSPLRCIGERHEGRVGDVYGTFLGATSASLDLADVN